MSASKNRSPLFDPLFASLVAPFVQIKNSRRVFLKAGTSAACFLSCGLHASAGASAASLESESWSLLVNTQNLPSQLQELIHQIRTNPGQFSFNYAQVKGHSVQANKMQQFRKQHGLQLEEINFKDFASAHKALSKGVVDMVFMPASAITKLSSKTVRTFNY